MDKHLQQKQAASSPLRYEIDLTLDPQPEPHPLPNPHGHSQPHGQSQAQAQPHPMKLTLDAGKLTHRSTNQDLVSFLDLHRKYHHEFLKRLETHVREQGYGWQDLIEQESELASCARGFVKRNGRRYWGSHESREKYFYKDAFRDLDALAVYPQRKDEVVKLLLEKKARSVTAENQGRTRKRSIPKEFYIPSPERVNDPLDATLYDGRPLFTPAPESRVSHVRRSSTSKHPESNGDTPSTPTTTDLDDTSPSKNICPFRLVTDLACPSTTQTSNDVEMEMHEPSTSISNQCEVTRHSNTGIDTGTGTGTGSITDPFVRLYLERSYYPERTIFLVSSTRQPDMGPVWIPFRDFSSASSFLESMARECHPDEYDYYSWDYDQNQNQNQGLIAATVRLEWSELVVIRVRHGRDQDWAVFRRELQRAWSASTSKPPSGAGKKNPCCESDLQGNPNDGTGDGDGDDDREQKQRRQQQFKISVRLHIMD